MVGASAALEPTAVLSSTAEQLDTRSASNSGGDQHRCDVEPAMLWHIQQACFQSVLQQQLCWMHHASMAGTSGAPADSLMRAGRRRSVNRKGLQERLRRKRTQRPAQKEGPGTGGGGGGDEEASSGGAEPREVDVSVHTSDDDLHRAVSEKDDRIQELLEELQHLQCVTACADAAKDDAESAWHAVEYHKACAEGADGRAQAATQRLCELEGIANMREHRISELELANGLQAAHAAAWQCKCGELEDRLQATEVDLLEQQARNAKLQEKVQELAAKLTTAELGHQAQATYIDQLTEQVSELECARQAAEIESGMEIARNTKLKEKVQDLEAKLHTTEIDCGGEIARNSQLKEKMQDLQAKLHTTEIDCGGEIARNLNLNAQMHTLAAQLHAAGGWCEEAPVEHIAPGTLAEPMWITTHASMPFFDAAEADY